MFQIDIPWCEGLFYFRVLRYFVYFFFFLYGYILALWVGGSYRFWCVGWDSVFFFVSEDIWYQDNIGSQIGLLWNVFFLSIFLVET